MTMMMTMMNNEHLWVNVRNMKKESSCFVLMLANLDEGAGGLIDTQYQNFLTCESNFES